MDILSSRCHDVKKKKKIIIIIGEFVLIYNQILRANNNEKYGLIN